MNQHYVCGFLGRDPTTTYTREGAKPVTKLSIGVRHKYKKNGAWEEATDWVKCVLFGRLAEIARDQLHKGDKVLVEGRVATRTWIHAESQEKRYQTETIVTQLEYFKPPSDPNASTYAPQSNFTKPAEPSHSNFSHKEPPSQGNTYKHPTNGSRGPTQDDYDDDIPF